MQVNHGYNKSFIYFLENCNTSEDITLLTICLSKTNEYVTYDVVKRFIDKVEQLLSTNVLNVENYSAILKVIIFLNFNWWKEMCTQHISRYILLFRNHCHLLSVNDLLTLHYVCILYLLSCQVIACYKCALLFYTILTPHSHFEFSSFYILGHLPNSGTRRNLK